MQGKDVIAKWSPIKSDFVIIDDGNDLFIFLHATSTLEEAFVILTRGLYYAKKLYDEEVLEHIWRTSLMAWAYRGKHYRAELVKEMKRLAS